MRSIKNIIRIMFVSVFLLLLSPVIVNAASAKITASPTTAYVGDSVTITATYTAAAWNLTISGNGVSTAKYADVTADAENATKSVSVKLNTSKAGSYTVKLTGDITDGTTGDTVNVNKSVTVVVKEKPVEQKNTVTNNTVSQSSNQNTTSQNTTSKTTKSQNTTSQTTTKKTNTTQAKKEEVTEKVEDVLEFGISKLTIFGIKENGEKQEINLTPEFNINTYEYKAIVTADIQKLEIVKNANNYDEYLQITGIEENLKGGENIIILKLQKDEQLVEYKIIVEKEIPELVVVSDFEETQEQVNEENNIKSEQNVENQNGFLKFLEQHVWCLGCCLVLMIIEGAVFVFIIRKNYIRKEE